MRKISLTIIALIWTSLGVSSCEKLDETIATPDDESFQMIPYLTFEQWEKRQGGAIYKDKLVCFNAMDKGGRPQGFIYDVRTGIKLCEMSFSFSLDNKDYYPPHANQVSFSNQFYDAESDFPLLYISQVNGGNGRNDIRGELGVLVYNLRRISENYYIPELVQAIIPDLNDNLLMSKIGNYTPNYIVDTDNNQLVVIGYPNNSWYDLSGPQPIVVFRLPSIIDGHEIVLTKKDVLESFTLPVSLIPQQSFYYGEKIFTVCGFPNQAALRVINLSNKSVEFFCDMTSVTSGEPQFLGLWNEKLLYYEYNTSGIVYELIFPGYSFINNSTSDFNSPFRYSRMSFDKYNYKGQPTIKTEKEIQIIVSPEGSQKLILK